MKKINAKKKLGFAGLLAVAVLMPTLLLADSSTWTAVISSTAVFQVRMPPEGQKKHLSEFLIDKGRQVRAEGVLVVSDDRPKENSVKTYQVKFSQSLGPDFKPEEMAKILEREFDTFEKFYAKMGGVVKKETTDGYINSSGGEILINYDDPKMGPQVVRARVLFYNTTLLHQVFVGPSSQLNVFSTRDFFDSLTFVGGVAKTEKTLEETWVPLESPSGLFTVFHPPEKVEPYYTTDPLVKTFPRSEMISLSLKDPARDHNVFYNVYGYSFNTPMTKQGAEEIIMKNHVKKFKAIDAPEFSHSEPGEDGLQSSEARFHVAPMEKHPYIFLIKVRATYKGNDLMVEEILTSLPLISSSFVKKFTGMTKFHPEKIAEKKAGVPKAAEFAPPATP